MAFSEEDNDRPYVYECDGCLRPGRFRGGRLIYCDECWEWHEKMNAGREIIRPSTTFNGIASDLEADHWGAREGFNPNW